MRAALIALLLVVGCKKDEGGKPADKPAVAPVPATPAAPGEPRKVAIEANKDGFVPDKIPGKAGEKLTLVFTRTIDAECLARIKVPGHDKEVELPLNKPVEVAVTVPKDGEVRFACWMDMFSGVVVAEKG